MKDVVTLKVQRQLLRGQDLLFKAVTCLSIAVGSSLLIVNTLVVGAIFVQGSEYRSVSASFKRELNGFKLAHKILTLFFWLKFEHRETVIIFRAFDGGIQLGL